MSRSISPPRYRASRDTDGRAPLFRTERFGSWSHERSSRDIQQPYEQYPPRPKDLSDSVSRMTFDRFSKPEKLSSFTPRMDRDDRDYKKYETCLASAREATVSAKKYEQKTDNAAWMRNNAEWRPNASKECASQAGFLDKYPNAFSSAEEYRDHDDQARDAFRSARNARELENKARKRESDLREHAARNRLREHYSRLEDASQRAAEERCGRDLLEEYRNGRKIKYRAPDQQVYGYSMNRYGRRQIARHEECSTSPARVGPGFLQFVAFSGNLWNPSRATVDSTETTKGAYLLHREGFTAPPI
ncbi:hypothetical protein LTR95_007685 [Oleoguttula sp. CCFEE 5521]